MYVGNFVMFFILIFLYNFISISIVVKWLNFIFNIFLVSCQGQNLCSLFVFFRFLCVQVFHLIFIFYFYLFQLTNTTLNSFS